MIRRRYNRRSTLTLSSSNNMRVVTLACFLLLVIGYDSSRSLVSAAFLPSPPQLQQQKTIVGNVMGHDHHRQSRLSLKSLDEKQETMYGQASSNGHMNGKHEDEVVMAQQLTEEMERYLDWINKKHIGSSNGVVTVANGNSNGHNHGGQSYLEQSSIEVSQGSIQAKLLAKISELESKLAQRQGGDDSSTSSGGDGDNDDAARFALEEVKNDLKEAKSDLEQAEATIKMLETIEQDLLFAVSALEEAAAETKSLHQEELDQLQHAKNYLQYALSDQEHSISDLEEQLSKQVDIQDLYQVLYATYQAKTQLEVQQQIQKQMEQQTADTERRQAEGESLKKENEEKTAALQALQVENSKLSEKIQSLQNEAKMNLITVQESKAAMEQEANLRAALEQIKEKLSYSESLLQEQSSKTVQQEQVLLDNDTKEKELSSMVEQLKFEQAQLFSLMSRFESMSQYNARNLQQSLERAKLESAESQSKVSDLQTSLSKTKEELDAISKKGDLRDRQIQLEQTQLKEQHAREIQNLEQSIQDKETSIASSDTTVKSLETKQKELSATISTLEASILRKDLELQKEQSALRKEQTGFEKALSEKNRELQASQRTISTLQDKQKQLMDKVSTMETTIKEEKQSAMDTTKELQTNKKELSQAQLKINQLEQQLAKAREDVTRANEKSISNAKTDVMPEISNWILTERGEIRGKVSKHPTMRNNEEIVTSALANPSLAAAQAVVETSSGSLYRLRNPNPAYARQASAGAAAPPPVKKTPIFTSPSNKVPSLRIPSLKVPGILEPVGETLSSKSLQSDYDLNGETIGNGKYLLSGKPIPTKNKRTSTMKAYLAGPDMQPKGDAVIVKLSSNEDAMQREYTNYQKLWSGVKRGLIVKCLDHFPDIDSKQSHRSTCALVLERGSQDLKQFLHFQPVVDDETLKNALFAVARCMAGIHAARFVWTDLKTENFVAFEDANTGKMNFKAIDLESAVPVKGHPIDYTPEACPPEFAKAFEAKEPHSFVLEYSYDVWSFGMMAMELSTGSGYFPDTLRWDAIIKRVAALESVDVHSVVSDESLADLLSKCLSVDPKQRPTSNAILKHPYFRGVGRTTGIFGNW